MVAKAQRLTRPPPRIGPFLIEGVIAQGGMGVIYRAQHEVTRAPAAVKTVRLRDESYLTSIRREVHTLAELRHPGVVRILAQGVDRELPWYAMEFLEGETLASYHRRLWKSQTGRRQAAAGRLTEALTLVRRVCEPLAFLHGEGVVHADLKPQNVFLRSDGRPILVDFGVSRRVGSSGREIPDLPALGGTPAYMAPHQVTGDLLEARDDLYALGCILYELVAGRPPFVGASAVDVAWQHLRAQPVPPSSLVDGVPPALDRLVLSLLEKQTRDRPGHADDVAEALEDLGAARESDRREKRRAYVYRPRLVGREAPLAQLMDLVDRLRSGEGAVALVAGESGIGKTYLALEVSRRAANAAQVVNGSCLPPGTMGRAGAGAPLEPLRETLLAVVDRCASEGRAAIDRLLGDRAKVLAAIEPAVARLPGIAAHPDPPALGGDAGRDRLLACVAETIRAFAQDQPLVLVLDDLQWADELTWRLLQLLAVSVVTRAPVLVLTTYRTDEGGSSLSEALSEPRFHVIRIGRLDDRSLGSLVSDMLAVDTAPDTFVRFLALQSEGNPFFVAEYLRTAVADGIIRRLSGRTLAIGPGAGAPVDALQALTFPATLREVIARRLRGLSPQGQQRIELAAVIGREFDIEVLDAAGGVDDSSMAELLSRQILEQVRSGALRFAHDKLREFAYERIAPERRGALHLAAAEAIVSVRRGHPDFAATSGVLAHHYLVAGRTAEAVDYLDRAGVHALSVGAYREAIGFLQQCLDLAGSDGKDATRVVRWRRQLSDAYTGVGNLAARAAEAEKAIATAGGTSNVPLFIAVPRALAQLGVQAVRARLPRRSLTNGSQAKRDLHLELARAHRHLAVVHYFQNEAVPVVVRMIDAVEHAERAGPSPELSGAYAEIGGGFGFAGFNAAAERYLRRAIQVAQEIGDPAALDYAHMLKSLYSVSVGHWQDVRSSADECQSICERIGDHVNWANAQIVRFWMHHYLGETEESAQAAQLLLARAQKIGNVQQEVWALCGSGLAELRRNRPAEALRYLEGALGAHEENDRNNLILTLGCAALARMRLGDVARAEEDAQRALAMLIRAPRPTGHATLEGRSAIAEVILRAPARRLDLARLSVEGLRRYRNVFPIGEARYRLWRGVFLSMRNLDRAAARSWKIGLRAATELSMRHDELLIRRELEPNGDLKLNSLTS
jgi:eukaryotic-like serine/threonine-protein kinase